MTQPQISTIKGGDSVPTLPLVTRLAKALDASLTIALDSGISAFVFTSHDGDEPAKRFYAGDPRQSNGGAEFSFKAAGMVPGSYAIYRKQVDSDGVTVVVDKTTVLPDGSCTRQAEAGMGRMESETPDALTGLIRWEGSLDGAIDAANESDRRGGPPVLLDRPAVRSVLQRCISGYLNVNELPKWAGAVHMLDRVEIAESDIELLTKFLFEVSTPELFVPVTVETCQQWTARLKENWHV